MAYEVDQQTGRLDFQGAPLRVGVVEMDVLDLYDRFYEVAEDATATDLDSLLRVAEVAGKILRAEFVYRNKNYTKYVDPDSPRAGVCHDYCEAGLHLLESAGVDARASIILGHSVMVLPVEGSKTAVFSDPLHPQSYPRLRVEPIGLPSVASVADIIPHTQAGELPIPADEITNRRELRLSSSHPWVGNKTPTVVGVDRQQWDIAGARNVSRAARQISTSSAEDIMKIVTAHQIEVDSDVRTSIILHSIITKIRALNNAVPKGKIPRAQAQQHVAGLVALAQEYLSTAHDSGRSYQPLIPEGDIHKVASTTLGEKSLIAARECYEEAAEAGSNIGRHKLQSVLRRLAA